MSSEAILAPVVKTTIVGASQAKAFRIFTEFFGGWWPSSHHIGKQPFEAAILECKPGGRWYERAADGTECEWGHVLQWEPPSRVVLSWNIQPDWTSNPDPARASEIEVRFIPESESSTRVELEHRCLERHGDGAGQMREQVNGGWPTVVERFHDFVAERGEELA